VAPQQSINRYFKLKPLPETSSVHLQKQRILHISYTETATPMRLSLKVKF